MPEQTDDIPVEEQDRRVRDELGRGDAIQILDLEGHAYELQRAEHFPVEPAQCIPKC